MNRFLLLLLAALIALPAAAQPRLFAAADGARATLTARQSTYLDHLEALRAASETRLVAVELGTLDAEAISFNLAPDATVALNRRSVERRAPDDASYIFESEDDMTFAVLVARKGQITGSVRIDGQLYTVRPLTDGLHAVVKLDESQFPDDHPAEWADIEAEAAERWAKTPYVPSGDEASPHGIFRQRVLVPYTRRANSQVADILGLIQLAIDETNFIYDNSNIFVQLDLAYAFQTTQNESGSMQSILDRLEDPFDGWNDDIYAKRLEYGADMVNMILGSGLEYCGLAGAILATTAFNSNAVTSQNCATGIYVFAHELGHLQGARHNPEADPTLTPFAYGHGKYYEPDSWRTVMSYPCPGSCSRRPYLSNPDVSIRGVPTGDLHLRDNARVLNTTALDIATLYGDPTGRIAEVEIERLSTSPLPASGGLVRFEATVTGLGPLAFAGQVWITLTLPDRTPYGTIFGPQLVRVSAGQSFSRTLQFNVPAGAPGDPRQSYQVSIYAGNEDFPQAMVSFDSFTFSKASSGQQLADAATLDVTATEVTAEGSLTPHALSTTSTPGSVTLHAAYPNPFTSETTLGFETATAGAVQLAVYDVLGREIAVLVNGEVEAGRHTAAWDAPDLPSGMYLVRLTAAGFTQTQRLTLVR